MLCAAYHKQLSHYTHCMHYTPYMHTIYSLYNYIHTLCIPNAICTWDYYYRLYYTRYAILVHRGFRLVVDFVLLYGEDP